MLPKVFDSMTCNMKDVYVKYKVSRLLFWYAFDLAAVLCFCFLRANQRSLVRKFFGYAVYDGM